jgi:integrase
MAKRGYGEGSIYQKPNGRWAAQLRLPGGARKTFYGASKSDVREKLKEAQRAAHEGVLVPAPNMTVREYLEGWLERVVASSVRPKTYEAARLNVRRIVRVIGGLKLQGLSPASVQSAYGALLREGLSKRSVEQSHEVLHRALRQAVQWGLTGRNPADAVSVPRPGRHEMKTLSEEEVRRLFEAAKGDRWQCLWVLLATTGLRIGEALGLRWDDVDLERGRLEVRRALQRQTGRGLVFVEPKSARSRRGVHLAPAVVTRLREHHARQAEERRFAGENWTDQGLVFTTLRGGPVEHSTVTYAFGRALSNAGLERIRIHDLRHTAATLLLKRQVHPKVVQELLGHSSISLTLDTYSHVVPSLHAEVAGHMQALFDAPVPNGSNLAANERGRGANRAPRSGGKESI